MFSSKRLLVVIVGSLSIAAATFGVPALPPAERSGKELTALEQKLHGAWKGGACVGTITFQPIGTYEWRGIGPGNLTRTGTWQIRWNSLPPTLILTCKNADIETEIGKNIELKVVQLDDSILAVQYPQKEVPTRFSRPEK